jgi:hypothetical protein
MAVWLCERMVLLCSDLVNCVHSLPFAATVLRLILKWRASIRCQTRRIAHRANNTRKCIFKKDTHHNVWLSFRSFVLPFRKYVVSETCKTRADQLGILFPRHLFEIKILTRLSSHVCHVVHDVHTYYFDL